MPSFVREKTAWLKGLKGLRNILSVVTCFGVRFHGVVFLERSNIIILYRYSVTIALGS